MMLSMLGANSQELQLHASLVRIIRADLAVLHRQKISKLVQHLSQHALQ
jgi:2-phospho-L-lactate guanylyltransferase (CobY/MobA/RfbA family)